MAGISSTMIEDPKVSNFAVLKVNVVGLVWSDCYMSGRVHDLALRRLRAQYPYPCGASRKRIHVEPLMN